MFVSYISQFIQSCCLKKNFFRHILGIGMNCYQYGLLPGARFSQDVFSYMGMCNDFLIEKAKHWRKFNIVGGTNFKTDLLYLGSCQRYTGIILVITYSRTSLITKSDENFTNQLNWVKSLKKFDKRHGVFWSELGRFRKILWDYDSIESDYDFS